MSYSQSVEVIINDHDVDVVARNAILLLIALVVEDMDEAVECIIHVWYSALIRKSDLDILQIKIRPLVKGVCDSKMFEGESINKLVAADWQFEQRSLRLVLEKTSWDRLLSLLDTPEGLTAAGAQQIRQAVTLANSRKDWRDRYLLLQRRAHQVPMNRFREEGILLPFGSQRKGFQEPNP